VLAAGALVVLAFPFSTRAAAAASAAEESTPAAGQARTGRLDVGEGALA
jgi:hypothetical protein